MATNFLFLLLMDVNQEGRIDRFDIVDGWIIIGKLLIGELRLTFVLAEGNLLEALVLARITCCLDVILVGEQAVNMPAERAFSLLEIVDILREYDFSKQRRLSFEYIVFKGVNDSLVYAKELLKLLRGIDCRINLIRFHAIPGVALEGADMETMTAFRDYLTSHGLFTTIRASRGEDIFAACGMLSTAKQEGLK
jgi:hypothetical protein